MAPRYAHCLWSVNSFGVEKGVRRTDPRRTGTVANTARTKNIEMILGPLLGSGLKMWLISANFPYLNGFSYFGLGALGSAWIARSKTWTPRGFEVPEDARRRVAWRGFDAVKS